MKKPKPDKRRPCANCGDLTSFSNAIGEREKLGWCPACFRVREKNLRVDNKGEEHWLEPPGLYRRKSWAREEEKS